MEPTTSSMAAGPASFEPTFVLAAEPRLGRGNAPADPASQVSQVSQQSQECRTEPHGPRRPGREEALARLADRYVTSHGPVTERDFAGWCDQPLRLVREAVALTDGRVRTEQVGETAYLVHADAPPAAAAHGGDEGTLLLPGFDEWLLGYKDRRAQLTPEQERAVVPLSLIPI